MRRKATTLLIGVAIVLALLATWEVCVRWLGVPRFVLPPPSEILWAFVLQFPMLLPHIATTLGEIVLGLVFAVLVGTGLGVALFYVPALDRALHPLIIASQMIPVFAIAPLLIVWFGYGLWPKVAVAAMIGFFPMVVNVTDGLKSTSPDHIDLLRSLGATRWQILTKLRFPSSLPSVMSGLKVAATLSVVGATIGEWVGARQGLGYLMVQSHSQFRDTRVFAAILALTIVGLLLYWGIRLLENRVLRWRTAATDGDEELHGGRW